MSGVVRLPLLCWLLLAAMVAPVFLGRAAASTAAVSSPSLAPFPIMLGIDVLEADGFKALKGKRVGLLTHPAAVNRHGVSTVEILHRAPNVQLVALYAVEHGIYNDMPAEKPFPDLTDGRTGLRVFSLYNGKTKNFRPTPRQLEPIDVLVIDLQDIGVRSYTFTGAMKSAMEACFENGKEVVVLDRPNPLGGLKVSGPLMDADLMTDVGRFRVPYVHGLTIGELAHLTVVSWTPGGLSSFDAKLAPGKLTVVRMRGWTRSMRWPDTGLPFVPTSRRIQDFDAVLGYPMTGLGCIAGGFSHGLGSLHSFRALTHRSATPERVERELRALNLPGLQFRRISGTPSVNGRAETAVYADVTDPELWEPTELNFRLMKLAAQLQGGNPYATLSDARRREWLIHVGSRAFYNDLVAKGADIDIDAWLQTWREQGRVYQRVSQRFWLYR